ncbi:hypothetical protein NEF87_001421 [Candidatus Lokiarchaeum ossiferum]|uniref:S-adenosyl-L-methionine-dependent tRNA 4-demethylwyosine synthase n=1 Tax=Candidatus Lokiarchaeum ossiferum TaxID=2951803 RepID=A0ABY6HRE5_9ARCH|nr:hypothetical protein NEF87_001421 [Candidatus Lokiarchaeum sp. B-35]
MDLSQKTKKNPKKSIKIAGFDKDKLIKSYMKSNYRIIGPLKHSAVKPCHWQEQKMLTGRSNRNCYKGYFGIESEGCIQNTPALPFCNHQCVFCWRDIENSSFGAEWKGDVDEPKLLAREMIRHSQNLIFEHITLKKSLENFDLMHKILYHYVDHAQKINSNNLNFGEMEIANLFSTTRAKIHRAMLLLKNCKILLNPEDDKYVLTQKWKADLKSHNDVDAAILKEVTTKEEIIAVFERAKTPKHAAISLAGEPTLYPRIGEFIEEFRKRNMCTFIVSNGTHPSVIRKLYNENHLPTQLYITLPASNRKSFNQISRPMTKHAWENLLETLQLLPELPCRTVVRITAVKYLNINLDMVPEYVKILKGATPNFIDIKGFTVEAHALELQNRLGHLGENRELRDYAPTYDDLLEFAQELERQGGFEIIETHEPSRDILLRGSWPKDKSIKIDFSKV